MKPLIVGLAIVILFTAFTIYQQDNNTYIRQLEYLKYIADECADSAALYYNTTEFGEGRKVFNQDEGIKAIEYMLKDYLNLYDDLTPKDNSYWVDPIEYNVYFFDYSNTTFPTLFTEPITGYVKSITEPTVVVTINAGRPKFRLPFLSADDAVRTSAYEYQER